MMRFIAPREINYGWGALSALKYIEATRVLIVTDKIIDQLGHVAKVQALLKDKGIPVALFNEVAPDPSRTTVAKAFSSMQSFQPDLIIALGGGSPIDTAKVAWIFYEHPELATAPWSDVLKNARRQLLRKKARLIAIPCTSGTGSESTCAAMITDDQATPHIKTMILSVHIVPDMAIVDAQLAATMPANVTADTGFDALVHAVEGYLYTPPSEMVDIYAKESLRTVIQWLPKAVANGNDTVAREKMHLAAMMSGMVIGNGRLGLIHDCAHQLGTTFGVPHGRACALMARQIIAFLHKTHKSRIFELVGAAGLSPLNEMDATKKLIQELETLEKQIGLPSSIKEAGITEKSFLDKLDEMSRLTVVGHPQEPPTAPDVKELYLKAWQGAKPEIVIN